MAKRGRVEIIEVLPTEPARPFDGLAPSAAVPGPPPRHRRWWIVPAAAAGILAVVIAASVLSDSDQGSGRAGRPDASQLDGVAKVAPAVLPLVPATPDGYRIAGVEQRIGEAPARRPVRQLWATHVETALMSSWLEITASPTGLPPVPAGDRRVAVPAGIAVLDTASNGDLRITGPIAGGAADIVSSGVSRATLVELLGSLSFDGPALGSTDPRLGGMFQQVAADDGAALTSGNNATLTVAYRSVVSGPPIEDEFDVTVGPLGASYDETARQFFLSSRNAITVNGQKVLLGGDERSFGTTSVTFERAGLRVTIDGTAPSPVLLAAVQSVHVATGGELAALLGAGPIPADATAPAVAGVQVASGDLGGNVGRYTIEVRPGDDGTAAVTLTSTDGTTASGTVPMRESYVATVASATMTALVAFAPASSPDARLVVALGDPPSARLSAAPVDAGADVRVAAVAFGDVGPFTAQLQGADGGILSVAAG